MFNSIRNIQAYVFHIFNGVSKYAFIICLQIFIASMPLRAQIDAESMTNMGRNALGADDYITAIQYFNRAIESKPFLSAPYYYRAYAKFTLEDYHGAESDCNKSLELNPFIMEVYQLRGLCRIHNNDYQGAIADYTRVLKENPEDQSVRYNRSLCYLQLKNYAQADSDLTFMIQKWPKYYRTYLVKAQSAMEQKDTLQGIHWIDRLLEVNPKEANAWSFKGRYELGKEHYALADSCLSQAILYQPNDFELYIARAQARHALGKFSQAIADYDHTIKLQPTHFVAHYNRGLLRYFVGDLNNALSDFDFIIQTEPRNTLALYNRAQIRAKVGNYKGAVADYTQLIRIYPNFMYGYMQRASLRRKLGDIRGALNDETVVARRNLDVATGNARPLTRNKVRLRSDHELDKYQQLVQEDPDTVRNVFGMMFGKVQNEKVTDEFMPMYTPAFCATYTRGYHSVGFMPEMNQYKHVNTRNRVFAFTAQTESHNLQDAEGDERQIERVSNLLSVTEKALLMSAVHMARYDYTSALNDVNQALASDSISIVALIQRSNILVHLAATVTGQQSKSYSSYALASLQQASRLAPDNAYVLYNAGCLLAQQEAHESALQFFTQALQVDARLPEAYYNRALLYLRMGEKEKGFADLSRAGQLGLYKAYALIKQNQ
ncbi:MAG: tetratricopeptide repeat protein [Prevotellamassilia sp.]|nr:tetratricopeptide repeat protein [Prevotellamassilia sp.]